MYLKWCSTCYKCDAPLEPAVISESRAERKFVGEYKKIRPIFLWNNMFAVTFVGLKLKRVCYSCYVNKVKIQPKLVRLRECGQLKHIAPRSKSKTQSEIVQWFEGLLRAARSQGITNG